VEEGVNVEQILGQNPNGAMKVPSREKGWRKEFSDRGGNILRREWTKGD
jgi:hypothetical protein